MKKRIIISGVSLLLIAIVVYYFYNSKNKPDVIYWRSVPVEKGDVTVLYHCLIYISPNRV